MTWLLVAAAVPGCVHLAATAPALVLVAALVPAVCFAGLLVLVDRYEHEPGPVLLAAFLWGAVVASVVVSPANDALYRWLSGAAGEVRAGLLAPVLAAPLVEEAGKGAVLLVLLAVLREEFDSTLDGIVYGALVGFGFAVAENASYLTLAAVQGGQDGLLRAVYLRGLVEGCNHALFTATAGAGLGYAREARSRAAGLAAAALGFGGAVAQHVAWNGAASGFITAVLCNPAEPGGMCREPLDADLLVTVPLVVAAFVGPGAVTLALVAGMALRREARVVAAELRPEVRDGILDPVEHARLSSVRGRLATEWRALAAGGLGAWRRRRRFDQAATELAFRRWHLGRGEEPKRTQRDTDEDEYRTRLALGPGRPRETR